MKKHLIIIATVVATLFTSSNSYAGEHKEKLAIVNIDVQGFHGEVDPQIIQSMMYFEMENLGMFEILDKYDVKDVMTAKGYEPNAVMGLNRQLEIGKELQADLILNGSVELFGRKIVVLTKLVQVATGRVRKSDVMEYVHLNEELQRMVRISLRNLMDLENNKNEIELLVQTNQPINSPQTTLRLNGPRMGASMVIGPEAVIMQADSKDGGFELAPVNAMFGYQHEFQYLSSGEFQALVEVVGNFTGIESGKFIPSLTIMNGFRFNKSGVEFALGPVFRPTRTAKGFYDDNGDWTLWRNRPEFYVGESLYRTDSRGSISISTGLVIAAGKTFTSGYLNFPVNLYAIPKKGATIVGLSVGFNMAKP